ncbi:iron-sulfur cluster assembly accessory protein [Vibrio sonorensis]|uniref:iron-sulfur cluster assembly accessory protein n=1 Tax=Vibrio sonorensis TaxID=1004316 RepID=UPI0008DA25B1|nr:iron-sulfur cluster assembly accessory protein [Vibrio sonorensis]
MSDQALGSTEISVHDMEWKGVKLTEAAAARINQLTKGSQHFLIDVKPSGCTGFAYDVKLVETPDADALSYQSFDTTFYVALKAMPMVDGTEVDFVREGLNQSFVYHNPNVKNLCGCGESFGV